MPGRSSSSSTTSSARYYFIEMNTRIQVEHPVSEMVTGIDLIKLQLRSRRAIRCRSPRTMSSSAATRSSAGSTPKTPIKHFAPKPGRIESFRAPGGFGVRLDTHIETGYVIPPFYDSMIGKLIGWGNDRDEAIARALRALDEMQVEGVTTTAAFQRDILDSATFRSGDFNTAFVANFLEGETG